MQRHFKLANDLLGLGLGQFDGNNPSANQSKLNSLKGLPFYCWDTSNFGFDSCCFQHLLGLPRDKDGIEHPLYPYERTIVDLLEIKKHVYILKATGLGITELMLRFMSWLCLRDDKLKGSQMIVITGPRIDLAITLIDRMKRLFYANESLGIKTFHTKETVLELNDVKIKAFPSHHLDAARGLPNVSFILLDEGDFLPPAQQDDARDVSERYIGKSNPFTILVSIPNAPEMLFDKIGKEPESDCIYKRLRLDYSYGINTIYSNDDIAQARLSPSWEREYCLKFGGSWGNIFTAEQIDQCISLGLEYGTDKIPVSQYTLKSVGIDPAFSFSAFGLVCLEHIKTDNKDIIRVVDCQLIQKADPNQMVELCWDIWKQHGFMNCLFYIDGSNRAMVNLLKIKWNESLDWETNEEMSPELVKVIPVNFNTQHKNMIGNLHAAISKGYLAIDPKYDKLLTSLRTAYAKELTLDKEQTSYNDLLDGLRLSLKGYNLK